ncbi:lytic polysaccharide monooxygenase auxiliary activity family 9 protein [Cellulomonas xiejunii]|uniref:Lytic polysaccharide monooxygenase n=1 Tax=Cellulomonas xiejunii TaxID=2968083 RepID=A0ABY5KSU4_9CELL|nr:lytic polysaccharide monooxygenase [Cellulomonas xiejunii]MCC2322192.1 lytic polysaccharide monooxygenase [Cellulomonas xiejunii]UUI72246.1 lytic polysaccharide monooxygenase [Cellulomonas xiejunii]
MSPFSPVRRAVAAAGALALGAALLAGSVLLAAPASAHGAVSDPPSRIYGCYDRWSGNHTDPAMATQDPMCWDAWRANPNAMWNWNGMFKENVGGRHEQAIPDGKLCSADNPIYEAANKPGAWRTTAKPYDFRLTVHDPSNHGADYLKIYVTKQGYDARTKALAWSDLELIKTTGRYSPSSPYVTDVSVPRDRTGHHVVFTIWQASHLDQPYYQCSDVQFGGGGDPGPNPTTPAPTTPAPTTPAPTTPAPTTPAPTTPAPTTPAPTTPVPDPGTGACTATVSVQSSWQGGYQASVTVKAGSAAITGWKVTVAGATITQAWNGTASGSTITAAAWNGSLAPGATATAGFLGSGSSSNLSATCSAA